VRHLGLKRMQEEVEGLSAEIPNVPASPDDK